MKAKWKRQHQLEDERRGAPQKTDTERAAIGRGGTDVPAGWVPSVREGSEHEADPVAGVIVVLLVGSLAPK
jgi:hypothetical protein